MAYTLILFIGGMISLALMISIFSYRYGTQKTKNGEEIGIVKFQEFLNTHLFLKLGIHLFLAVFAGLFLIIEGEGTCLQIPSTSSAGMQLSAIQTLFCKDLRVTACIEMVIICTMVFTVIDLIYKFKHASNDSKNEY